MAVAAYVLSPLDLISDFIPVLGLVDDLIILPLGIVLAVRLVPAEVMNEHRRAAARAVSRPVSRVAAALVALTWACWWIRRSKCSPAACPPQQFMRWLRYSARAGGMKTSRSSRCKFDLTTIRRPS